MDRYRDAPKTLAESGGQGAEKTRNVIDSETAPQSDGSGTLGDAAAIAEYAGRAAQHDHKFFDGNSSPQASPAASGAGAES